MTLDAAGARARARYGRLQDAMARRQVGALLLATPHLAAFASGARRVQVAGSGGSVPWVVVAAGAPSAVVFTTDPDGAPSWMPRTAVLPIQWERDRQLARIAELLAGTDGPVGCDVWSPPVRALVADLGRPLVDAMPIVAEAMAGRTGAEVEAIRAALAAARTGVMAAAAAVRPGATPGALVAAASVTMSPAASGFPLAEGLVWRLDGPRPRRAPETFAPGDVVAIEWSVSRDGHAGVAGTTTACGGAGLTPRRRRWLEASCAIAGACRVGRTTANLRAAARAMGATQAGPVAHGLGVGIEPPLVDLAGDEAMPLAAGTVLVLAHVVDGYRATRALVVGDGAARWLEPAP